MSISRNTRTATEEQAVIVLNRAKNEYVPRDTDVLHDSGRVDMLGSNQYQAQARISFDGPYAIPIHELPNYNPPTWDGTNVTFRVGGPKYIEKPLREEAPKMARRIGKKLKL